MVFNTLLAWSLLVMPEFCSQVWVIVRLTDVLPEAATIWSRPC